MIAQAAQAATFSMALKSIFGFVITSASALEKVAKAADNLGEWAVESTGTFVDEARLDRQSKVEEIQRRMALSNQQAQQGQQAQLPAPAQVTKTTKAQAAT